MLLEEAFMPTPLWPIILIIIGTAIAEFMTNSAQEDKE